MPTKIIYPLPVKRWPEYKTLRLTSLQTDPTAFARSYEEESIEPDEFWQNRLQNTDSAQSVFAESNEKLVGSITLLYKADDCYDDEAKIVAVYVLPEFRDQGIAQQMLDKVVELAKQNNKFNKLVLGVYEQNQPAINFYIKNGFAEVSRENQDIWMQKIIEPA